MVSGGRVKVWLPLFPLASLPFLPVLPSSLLLFYPRVAQCNQTDRLPHQILFIQIKVDDANVTIGLTNSLCITNISHKLVNHHQISIQLTEILTWENGFGCIGKLVPVSLEHHRNSTEIELTLTAFLSLSLLLGFSCPTQSIAFKV